MARTLSLQPSTGAKKMEAKTDADDGGVNGTHTSIMVACTLLLRPSTGAKKDGGNGCDFGKGVTFPKGATEYIND